ncbi:hypothetical protein [Avibacterium sp. 21-599]|uniref:hypothetical protein n=1 Tax=Avibacterium sp. 21-599 TaxID=2911528 RepID=UPI0022453C15|nr:hypothetical protein [Avibacterium sp. 21-599]MCW9718520.1 hypothetical protein [Avibacterium sp. 21-599]
MSSGNKALLASASYVDFFDSNGNKKDTNSIREVLEKRRSMNKSQIDQFLNTYEVMDQQLETASGFSAMVVREKVQVKISLLLEEQQIKLILNRNMLYVFELYLPILNLFIMMKK